MTDYNTIIFGGGMIYNLPAYIGAAEGIMKTDNQVTKFAGSGCGSIIAGLLACGATTDQIKDLSQDPFYVYMCSGHIRDAFALENIQKHGSIFNNKMIINWIQQAIKKVCHNKHITLQEINSEFGHDIAICTTSLNTGLPVYFCNNPKVFSKNSVFSRSCVTNVELWGAIFASISVPFLMAALECSIAKDNIDFLYTGLPNGLAIFDLPNQLIITVHNHWEVTDSNIANMARGYGSLLVMSDKINNSVKIILQNIGDDKSYESVMEDYYRQGYRKLYRQSIGREAITKLVTNISPRSKKNK